MTSDLGDIRRKAKAKERRLDNKKRQSQKKSLRRQKDFD